ncbi:hypothetical protein [Auraticoccus monumenti]|uniref:Pectate lyase superfamily protein n=1 Tax=Auraticoccus monumenti TaxID=675864 RepID=A0A1G7F3U9_9ACTN|nr:hypothetical protein [Auraticoccus monumenti]SDE70650.1 hypothetical protein SAMN04489747_4138 [Auraticoccus monumenti]
MPARSVLLVVITMSILLGLSSAGPSPGRLADQIVVEPVAPSLPTILSATFSAGEAGAVADDGLDDTAAIQTAIDRAAAAGGGWVLLASGVFELSVDRTTKVAIILRTGVGMRAANPGTSTLKLRDRQGDYHSILYVDPRQQATDLALHGLNFDQNSRANPLTSLASFGSDGRLARFVINIPTGRRVLVDDCSFFDARSRNVVVTSGPAGSVSDVVIRQSRFLGIGGGAWDFDHSSIYATGERIEIVGNIFTATSSGANGAHTAIETHGSDFLIADNVVSGYLKAMNLTGVASRSDRQMVRDNHISDVAIGLYLWSRQMGPVQRTAALREVSITDNHILINTDICRRPDLQEALFCAGVALEPGSDSAIDSLVVARNHIAFTGARPWGSIAPEPQEAGISLWQANRRTMSVRGLRIQDNTVVDSPSSSIAINVRLLPWSDGPSRIDGNELTFSGDHLLTSSTTSDGGAAAVVIQGAGNVRVELTGNAVVDQRRPAVLSYAISATGSCQEFCTVGTTSVEPSSITSYDLGSGWRLSP